MIRFTAATLAFAAFSQANMLSEEVSQTSPTPEERQKYIEFAEIFEWNLAKSFYTDY